ncbi:MAG: nickel-dependent lactate racemase [Acidobacteria bacterium]|nr:nickel-dependent lactate racemase [Acidobacteriota bacterium]
MSTYKDLKTELDILINKNEHIKFKEYKPTDNIEETDIARFNLAEKLNSFLSDSKELLIIVNDAMRPTQTAEVLSELKEIISKIDYKILIATGSHRPANDAEIKIILGDIYNYSRDKVINHDSRDDITNIYLGCTKRGTEVFINRFVKEAEKVLIISSVEPHWFAGYTGGRKSLVPGIAGIKTIRDNHQHAMNPNSLVLKLKGNPVHEDIEDAISLIGLDNIFSIQLVQNSDNKICDVFTGNITESFYDAVDMAGKIYSVSAEKMYDCVIAVVPNPLDNNLYQAHKGLENTKSIMKEGGTFIMVAACPEGIGQDVFYKLLLELKDTSENIKREYHLGDHKAYKLLEFLNKNRLIIISDYVFPGLDKLEIDRYTSLTKAFYSLGRDTMEIAVIWDAGVLAVT